MTIRIDGTNTAANPGITGTDTDTGLQFGTDEVNVVTGGSTRATVDSSGRLLVGTTSARSADFVTASIQNEGTNQNTSSIQLTCNSAASVGTAAELNFSRSRGSAVGDNNAVSSGDNLGIINFTGADGTDLNSVAAQIRGIVDADTGSNDMPGRLAFYTTADGASSPTEQMRLTSTGDLRFNSGFGSVATAYGVRAWINFWGGATTIGTGRASGNMDAVTDNGTGSYTVNFTNDMPDDDYVCLVTTKETNNTSTQTTVGMAHTLTTSSAVIYTVRANVSAIDPDNVFVAIIR